MAKITKQQIEKLEAKCKNGFAVDLERLLFHNEKTFYKEIDIPGTDGDKYEAKLHFSDVYERFEKVGTVPELVISRLNRRTKYIYNVEQLAKIQKGEIVKRKSVKTLQDLTAEFTDEIILETIYKKYPHLRPEKSA